MFEIIHGDVLQVLPKMGDQIYFDAVITDPPYCSGGATLSAKQQPSSKKYTSTKTGCPYPDFDGDAKDQRSWTTWMAEWMIEARRRSKPGAPIRIFTDWRQLPAATDALQWSGWCWRGIIPWDKINARPQKGRFRQQAEFIIWGSNGGMPIDRPVPILPGAYRVAAPQKRAHQTEKPIALMRNLVKICEPGGVILDPFAGSGTTIVAALLEGYSGFGIESMAYYADYARQRAGTVVKDNSK